MPHYQSPGPSQYEAYLWFCDWPIYLTASADEWLSCLHTAISLIDPLANVAQNQVIADFLLTHTSRPFTFLHHPIVHTTSEHHLRFSDIHLQTIGFQPRFPLHSFLTQTFLTNSHSLNSVKHDDLSFMNLKIDNFKFRRISWILGTFWIRKIHIFSIWCHN